MLGRPGEGKRSAAGTILDLQDSQQGTDAAVIQECSKQRGEAAGRQVGVKKQSEYLFKKFKSKCEHISEATQGCKEQKGKSFKSNSCFLKQTAHNLLR